FPRQLAEVARAFAQSSGPVGLALEDIKRRNGSRRIGRRQSDAENKAGTEVSEIFDEAAIACDIAPAASERLAQRAHVHVDTARRQVVGLADAASRSAKNSERMRLVDHKQQIMS